MKFSQAYVELQSLTRRPGVRHVNPERARSCSSSAWMVTVSLPQLTRSWHAANLPGVHEELGQNNHLGHNVIMVGDVRAASAAAVYARAIEILLKGAPHRSFHLLRPRTAAAPQAPRHPETTVMGFADRCKAVPRP